jgi:hypothetical protein
VTDLKLGNGRTRVPRIHTSKRGRTYRRDRIVEGTVNAPTWFRRAMMKMRWFK